MINDKAYHHYGLLAELLSVAQFRIQDMGAVSVALTFLTEARNEFESNQPKAEEVTEAAESRPVGESSGKTNSGKVRKQKQRTPK